MAELVTRRCYACVVLTWNVNEQRPEDSATFTALREAAKDAHLVAVGLQVLMDMPGINSACCNGTMFILHAAWPHAAKCDS